MVIHDESDIFTITESRKRLDLDQVKKDLQKFAASHTIEQRTTKHYQQWDKRKFCVLTVRKYFKSWQDAMDACGVDYKKGASRLVNKETVDENLNKFANNFPAFKRTQKKLWNLAG